MKTLKQPVGSVKVMSGIGCTCSIFGGEAWSCLMGKSSGGAAGTDSCIQVHRHLERRSFLW